MKFYKFFHYLKIRHFFVFVDLNENIYEKFSLKFSKSAVNQLSTSAQHKSNVLNSKKKYKQNQNRNYGNRVVY